jgi:UDP-3-O-[3-hydroxymyristoyl] N-acetylglucosamine deacetylase
MTDSVNAVTTASVFQHTLKESTPWQRREFRRRRSDRVVVHPADIDTGVRIVYHHATQTVSTFSARWDSVVHSQGGTVLGDRHGVTLRGFVPLLAALRVVGIDNAVVDVYGPQIPSTLSDFHSYLDLLADTGVHAQSMPRRLLRVVDKVEVRDRYGYAMLSPATEFHASVCQSLTQPGKPTQSECATLYCNLDPASLNTRIPSLSDEGTSSPPPWRAGVARPLSEITTLPEALLPRMIDLLGHLMLAGAPLAGYIRAIEASPTIYQALLQAALERRAVETTTVDAHRTRNITVGRGTSKPVSCLIYGSIV